MVTRGAGATLTAMESMGMSPSGPDGAAVGPGTGRLSLLPPPLWGHLSTEGAAATGARVPTVVHLEMPLDSQMQLRFSPAMAQGVQLLGGKASGWEVPSAGGFPGISRPAGFDDGEGAVTRILWAGAQARTSRSVPTHQTLRVPALPPTSARTGPSSTCV